MDKGELTDEVRTTKFTSKFWPKVPSRVLAHGLKLLRHLAVEAQTMKVMMY